MKKKANDPKQLTPKLLENLQAPSRVRLEIFDTRTSGFGVRVGAKKKCFFVVRRINGHKVRLSLGNWPAVSLREARAIAELELNKIDKGEDPRAERAVKKLAANAQGENTFKLVTDRFTREYVKGKKRPLRPRTIEGYAWSFGHPSLRGWQNRPIATIHDLDVIKAVDAMEALQHHASARLLKAYLHKFFGWCCEKRLINVNPASHVRLSSKPADFMRTRFLSLDEVRQVAAAVATLENPYRHFVSVLMLTGQRRGETSMMRWDQLDLDGPQAIWKIPRENTKNKREHDVPLSAELVAVISSAPKHVDQHGALCPYVFTTDGKHPIAHFSDVKLDLDAAVSNVRQSLGIETPIEPWTWHDLRRSLVTGLSDMGVAPHVVEAVVNHVSGHKAGVAGIYNRSTYPIERRKALEAWSRLVLAPETRSNVLELRGA